MSFSNRLTTFFILMVLVPIIGIGALGYRLISATSSGRAGARAAGLITAASEVYTSDQEAARSAAQAVAEAIAPLPANEVRSHIVQAAAAAGLTRVTVDRDGRRLASFGNANAVAPGTVVVSAGRTTTRVSASVTTASQFVSSVSGPLSNAVLSSGGKVLASTMSPAPPAPPNPQGSVHLHGQSYASSSDGALAGFTAMPLDLTMLSDERASSGSNASSLRLEVLFLTGLALLAYLFALTASRGMNQMVKRFLSAATRLANRDFSARVPIEGNDEFAKLATEFNRMSDQLEDYIAQLDAERGRLREAIRRTGETFASSRDRRQLEALTLETAISGVGAQFGRMSRREEERSPLAIVQSQGEFPDAVATIEAAEAAALAQDAGFGEAHAGDLHVMASRMGETPHRQLAFGVLVVARRGQPFSEGDTELFRSLAAQAWRALDNVRLHEEAERKAVTDLLTGLANHGQFQTVLNREMEDVRRYHYPLGLILIDLDNFKKVNDTYGHLQGDEVLRRVAAVLSASSREGDTAARYGGEEMGLILPHTDPEGAAAIAERIRAEIAELTIPLVDGDGELTVTASVGVAAAVSGEKDELVADADAALYEAKRSGKNRVVRSAHAPL